MLLIILIISNELYWSLFFKRILIFSKNSVISLLSTFFKFIFFIIIINWLNNSTISLFFVNIYSSLYIPKGIFNRPSKYWRALEPESSDFDLISFNFCIAFSLTESLTFIKHICCSNGILLLSKFDNCVVYSIVLNIASLKNFLQFQGKLSYIFFCSNESLLFWLSLDNKSYNK